MALKSPPFYVVSAHAIFVLHLTTSIKQSAREMCLLEY
jgi:hypothetical protein